MLTNKLSKAVGILTKVKTCLNKPALLSLYYAFFLLNFNMDCLLGAQHFTHIRIK